MQKKIPEKTMGFKKGMKPTKGFTGRKHSEYTKIIIGEGVKIASLNKKKK